MPPPRSAAEGNTVLQAALLSPAPPPPLPELSELSTRETDACAPGRGRGGVRQALLEAGVASPAAGSDRRSGSSSARHSHAMAQGTPDSSSSSCCSSSACSTHTEAPGAGKPRRTLSDDLRSGGDVTRGSLRPSAASLAGSPAQGTISRAESWREALAAPPYGGGAWAPVEGFEGCAVDLSQLYVGQRVAEGTFGKVYQGVYRRQEVAVKILKLPDAIEGDPENHRLREMVAKQFWQETAMLATLQHDNIVQFVGASQKPPTFCLVTEFVGGGTLRAHLRALAPRRLPRRQALEMALDIARGMDYLHSQGIIHRDLKPANLLLTPALRVKVSDFGTSRVEGTRGSMTNEMGTYRWMAPEIIELQPYDRKADVFSFAIVLWELLTSEVPYAGMTSTQVAFAVCSKNLRPPLVCHIRPAMAKLLEECWQRDADARPCFAEVVRRLEGLLKGLGARGEEGEEEEEEKEEAEGLAGCANNEPLGFLHDAPGTPCLGAPSLECILRSSLDDSLDLSSCGSDSLAGWKPVASRPQGILPRLLLRRQASKPARGAFNFLTRTSSVDQSSPSPMSSAHSSPLISPAQ